MNALLLAAALIYQIPLTTLDGKTEQLTVEDDGQDGLRFLFCAEMGDAPGPKANVIGLLCKVERDGAEYWLTVPAR